MVNLGELAISAC